MRAPTTDTGRHGHVQSRPRTPVDTTGVPVNEAATYFFALLALASYTFVAAVALVRVLSLRWPSAATLHRRLAVEIGRSTLGLAAGVATFATLGSLYLSEVIGFPPCTWCWVQRGFMYPLAVVLLVTAAAGWQGVRRPAQVWALLGAATSAWHIAIERVPALQGTGLCDPTNPCSIRWVEHFGFVTIPVMAFAAFLLVATLLSLRGVAAHDNDSRLEATT